MLRSRWLAWSLIVLLCLPLSDAWGTLAARQSKTCGTINFSTEVTAGCTTILASEVDADFNNLVSSVNDITDANIDPAGLSTSSIANGAITGVKLAVGATTHGQQSASPSFVLFSTVETTMVSVSITTRGGTVQLGGIWGAYCQGAGSTGTVTIRIKRDASTLGTSTVVCGASSASTGGIVTATTSAMPLPTPFWLDTPTAGAHTYTITGQTNTANVTVQPGTGTVFALEFS